MHVNVTHESFTRVTAKTADTFLESSPRCILKPMEYIFNLLFVIIMQQQSYMLSYVKSQSKYVKILILMLINHDFTRVYNNFMNYLSYYIFYQFIFYLFVIWILDFFRFRKSLWLWFESKNDILNRF